MSHWIIMHCTPEREELQARHPAAYLLLSQIASRAKYRDCAITGLKTGQAFLGDFERAGILTVKVYRNAKAILVKAGLASFKSTTLGTTATLSDGRIFSITAPSKTGAPGAEPGQTKGTPRATNAHRDSDTQTEKRARVSSSAEAALSPSLSPKLRKKGREPKSTEPAPPEVGQLWEKAPLRSRQRSTRQDVTREWRAIPEGERPALETLLHAIDCWAACEDWSHDDGRYTPGLAKWVRERRWEMLPKPAAAVAVAAGPWRPSFPGERPPKPAAHAAPAVGRWLPSFPGERPPSLQPARH